MEQQKLVHPIPPTWDKTSRILILGSFPSVKSREMAYFYGHPQNRFWRVLSILFEEPFPENYDDCMRFKEYLAKNSPNTLLADGEFEYNTDHIIDLAKRGALDVLLPDPVGFGFTQFRKVMSECCGTKIMCSPHAWGVKAKVNITAHLAAAFPGVVPTIEGVPEDYIECYDETGYEFSNGILTIPEKPGFGMELEWSWPVPIYKPY